MSKNKAFTMAMVAPDGTSRKNENVIPRSTGVGIWIAILISSILFRLGHLPVTSNITMITPMIITRALVLNGIGGVMFGWLYQKKGLESAMISHFSCDIVIHVIFPLVMTFFV